MMKSDRNSRKIPYIYKKILLSGILSAILLGLITIRVAAQPKLFSDLPPEEMVELGPLNESLALRRRLSKIYPEVLDEIVKNNTEQLYLNLFDDITFTAILDYVEIDQKFGYAWIGYLDNVKGSKVTIVIKENSLSGSIISPKMHFQVRPVENIIHEIREIDAVLLADTVNTCSSNADIISKDCSNYLNPLEQEVITLTNQERVLINLHQYECNDLLTNAARNHSMDMAVNYNFSHTGSDGSSSSDRITEAGYIWNYCAENIAAGYTTAQAVHNGWMNSSEHRANILNESLCDIGVGYYYNSSYGRYWTQDFGRLQGVYNCAVEINYFKVLTQGKNLILTWATNEEKNLAGWNLYRSDHPVRGFEKINERIIPGTNAPSNYKYVDVTSKEREKDYFYKLEYIELDGKTKMCNLYN